MQLHDHGPTDWKGRYLTGAGAAGVNLHHLFEPNRARLIVDVGSFDARSTLGADARSFWLPT